MKILLMIILISFLIHIPRIYVDNKNTDNNKNHEEDEYQKSRSEKIENPRIFNWIYFDMNDEEWNEFTIQIREKLIKLFRKELGSILSNTKDDELVRKNEQEFMSLKPEGEVLSIWISDEEKCIRSCFNHEWCGGELFTNYGNILLNGSNVKFLKLPSKKPFVVECSLLKTLISKPHNPEGKVFDLIDHHTKIKRLSYSINIPENKTVSTRVYILWSMLQLLEQSCPDKEVFNITIPVVFEKDKKIYNNIGAIVVKYKPGVTTIKQLENKVNNNVYTCISSNYYMRFKSGSKIGVKIRQNSDIVFSCLYLKDCTNTSCYKSFTTYNAVADYGIYCMSNSYLNKCDISLTINTEDISIDKLYSLLPDNRFSYNL